MSNGVQKALDKDKKAREAAKVKKDQGPKAEMREERRKNMQTAFDKKNPDAKPVMKARAKNIINRRSARTRPETITNMQKLNKKFGTSDTKKGKKVLTERGYEDLKPLPKDREKKMYPIGKAKGGTVRLKSGGPVVDSYDYS
tara:strand:+ start:3220 stop:3645 length:426 start_codon:yes stop_codon:yes gene_type:complete